MMTRMISLQCQICFVEKIPAHGGVHKAKAKQFLCFVCSFNEADKGT